MALKIFDHITLSGKERSIREHIAKRLKAGWKMVSHQGEWVLENPNGTQFLSKADLGPKGIAFAKKEAGIKGPPTSLGGQSRPARVPAKATSRSLPIQTRAKELGLKLNMDNRNFLTRAVKESGVPPTKWSDKHIKDWAKSVGGPGDEGLRVPGSRRRTSANPSRSLPQSLGLKLRAGLQGEQKLPDVLRTGGKAGSSTALGKLGRLGKYARGTGGALGIGGAYLTGKYLLSGREEVKKARALPVTSVRGFLNQNREEELLRLRQQRLEVQDPEALKALIGNLGGNYYPQPEVKGSIRIGSTEPHTQVNQEMVSQALGALLGQNREGYEE